MKLSETLSSRFPSHTAEATLMSWFRSQLACFPVQHLDLADLKSSLPTSSSLTSMSMSRFYGTCSLKSLGGYVKKNNPKPYIKT